MYASWSNFTDILSQVSRQQLSRIGSDNGLVPIRRQAIIWTNDGIVYRHQSASMS